tara:strand:+ start:1706 stop:1990 length:285 start_codon:yes stop_codon:yes gene_type:complete
MSNVNDLLDSLKQKTQRKQELYGELERSLALQAFIPDVFAEGKEKSDWICASHWITTGDRELLRFVVTTSTGEVRTFKPDEVPENLKPTRRLSK